MDSAADTTVSSSSPSRFSLWGLAFLLVAQAALYGVLTAVSPAFEYGSPKLERPLILVLGLLATCFVLSLISLRLATRRSEQTQVACGVVLGAVVFRVIVLFSAPIQEVDIYRYVWDGAVVNSAVSPFRFSPQEVVGSQGNAPDEQLGRLVARRDSDAGLHEALKRVHFGELTTVYPPVSQVVFAVADRLTPQGTTVTSRVRIMKAVIVLFDLGVVGLSLWILFRTGIHAGWAIAYAWNPLVLKEFANSGHLDSIAVFFVFASVAGLAIWSGAASAQNATAGQGRATGGNHRDIGRLGMLGGLLALGIGAKLYGVVLLPLFFAVVWRRRSLLTAVIHAGVICVLSGLLLWPMFADVRSGTVAEAQDTPPPPSVPQQTSEDEVDVLLPPFDLEPAPVVPPPASGLTAFVSHWQMNDLLFMLIEENLQIREDAAGVAGHGQVWFSVVPDAWRRSIAQVAVGWLGPEARPFLLARIVTSLIFLAIALYLAFSVRDCLQPARVGELAFLTLAWFWLLSPTQNPWYWTWALPLVPFARNRIWLAVSGLTLVYYLRFWLVYHWETPIRLGDFNYSGAAFFDFIVVWLEFAPLLLLLLTTWALRLGTKWAKRSGRVGDSRYNVQA